MYQFQQPQSAQTLREAIAEWRKLNPIVAEQRVTSTAGAAFFHSHDACHVVFGLDASLPHEALVDTWMLFGTTATFRDFLRYTQLEEHQAIIKKTGSVAVLQTFVAALPNICRIIWYSRTMQPKWPWEDFAAYLDVPLSELRQRFAVRLIGVPHQDP